MFERLRLSTAQIGVAAGLLGAATGLAITAATGTPLGIQLASNSETPGDVSGPCDETEHANDPRCVDFAGSSVDDVSTTAVSTTSTTSTTSPTSTTFPSSTSATAPGDPGGEFRTLDAADAGTVGYTFDGSTFRLLSATPADGWTVDVEQAVGDEIDLDFRSGTRRVQVDIEIEHGQIRERVRFRDDATDERSETTDGLVTDSSTGGDDRSSSNSDADDHGDDDHSDDDRSGSDADSDDDHSDDDRSGSNSGPGSHDSDDGSSGSDDD